MSTPATQSFVAVAGAVGQLGSLIALNLRKRNVMAKAFFRPGTLASRTEQLRDAGVTITEVEMTNVPALTEALNGATTRSIPSDFAVDFTKTVPGSNRNLDLRREFHAKLDASGIKWISVLNGAFMTLVTGDQIPLINDKCHKIMYFGSPDQELDVTTVPDVAVFTAAVAGNPNPTPKILRIAGDSFSANDLSALVTRMRGEKYKPMWTGSVGFLRIFIAILKKVIGGVEDKLMPAWQGMQYLENMVSGMGKLDPLDNDRYPDFIWTNVEQSLREADAEKEKSK